MALDHGPISKIEKIKVVEEFFVRCLFRLQRNKGVMAEKAVDYPSKPQIIQGSFLFLVDNISLGRL